VPLNVDADDELVEVAVVHGADLTELGLHSLTGGHDGGGADHVGLKGHIDVVGLSHWIPSIMQMEQNWSSLRRTLISSSNAF
jgi:hypothetical protein